MMNNLLLSSFCDNVFYVKIRVFFFSLLEINFLILKLKSLINNLKKSYHWNHFSAIHSFIYFVTICYKLIFFSTVFKLCQHMLFFFSFFFFSESQSIPLHQGNRLLCNS